jgi:hypothetical protein
MVPQKDAADVATIANIQAVKSEITFFMEKVFQFSFVYIGSLFAILAGTKTETIKDLAAAAATSPLLVIAAAILLLNLVYLVIATSCTFAVLKRGYFILLYGGSEERDALPRWESFLRSTNTGFGYLSWNVDNHYLVLIFMMVFTISVSLFVYVFNNSGGSFKGIVTVLAGLHAVPLWALVETRKLDQACANARKERRQDRDVPERCLCADPTGSAGLPTDISA